MSAVDIVLYKWILAANVKREELDLPPGLIEDSIALLLRLLGSDYLSHLLITDTRPISLYNQDVSPLKMWLKSAAVDQHIIQMLEFAAYLRAFEDDLALEDKLDKLKRDRFWPIFFELAMAARMKAACRHSQAIALNRELPDRIGDFRLFVGDVETPCECSRLGHSPQVQEPHILAEHLSRMIADATSRISIPLVFKVRSADALTGKTYNLVLRLLRRCMADVKRSSLPTSHHEGLTSVCCGELTEHSEQMPFAIVNGVVTNVTGTDWERADSLKRVPAQNEEELSERFKAGERFQEFEAVRLFMKFGSNTNTADDYGRLATKLRKKLKQTKVGSTSYGKLVFIEVPFDLRLADRGKLNQALAEASSHSRTTLGIILANRESNPHYRYHYSLHGSLNSIGFALRPELMSIFDQFRLSDTKIDPITGCPYQRSWQEASSRAARI